MDKNVIESISKNKIEVVQEYFSKVNINLTDIYGWNSLMIAASCEQWDICEWLIHHKIDLRYLTPDRNTILHILANQRGNLTSDTPPRFLQVIRLCTSIDDQIWELSIQNGADPLVSNSSGETCLHLACLRGNKWAIQFLLKNINYTSFINLRTQKYMTPLQCATNQGHTEVAQLLNDHLQNNKDPNMRNLVPFRK